MKVWPVKHSPLLRQPERFIARNELQALIQKVTHNLVNIKDESGQFLLRLDDGRVIDTKGWNGWSGLTASACTVFISITSRPAIRRCATLLMAGLPTALPKARPPKKRQHHGAVSHPGLPLRRDGQPAYLPWLDSWAEWAMNEMPRTESGGMRHITLAEENHQQMWDDTLMMTVLPLAKIGKLLNRPQYVEEAVYQFLLHAESDGP